MVKIYNTEHKFLCFVDVYKDFYTEESIRTGTRTLCFKVPCSNENLLNFQEEYYIETNDYVYIIKELNLEDNDFIEVICNANTEDLDGNLIFHFDCFETNPENAYKYCVKNTGWTVQYLGKIKTVFTKQENYMTSMEGIRAIAEMWSQELWFDTKNKILYIYDFNGMGTKKGAYYSNELDLKMLTKQSNSYDYATVLYPYGKDGLTIKTVNNEKEYLENFSYSKKYIQQVWIDESIEYPDILYDKAKKHLNEIAVPRASYQVELAKLSPDVKLGDTVILVDKIKKIKQEQRIVKITRYANEPELDNVEISNLQPDYILDQLDSKAQINKEIKYLQNKLTKITADIEKILPTT